MVHTNPGDINYFAETNFRGQRRKFGIKRGDRSKHVYIIGKTGMGKSTLLENMTIQDIQAGNGVAVVDPHGEYAERILDFVPEHRVQDVIYMNPADTAYPVAFNIMENIEEDQRHILSSNLLGVFKKVFGPEVFSARMEYFLANAILALLEIPDSTLLGINRMFAEKEFRKRIVTQISDPIVRSFWENEFAKLPEQFMREAVAAIQNKVGQFTANPLIRNVIGQIKSSFNLRQIMDQGKIFIVNISKGRIGEENSRLLGAMIVTKIYLTAMSRVDLPESERNDFYLYVDEFQNFATESFASILSEARKYHLNLTVAHQYIAQMEETVQHAIFGNVGTMICFRVGAEDADILEKEFMPEFTAQDLVNLSFKNIYLKLMIDGLTSRPFSAETLPPFPTPPVTYRDAIIQSSRERYGTPRTVVEEKIRLFTESLAEATGGTLGPSGEVLSSPADHASVVAAKRPASDDRPLFETKCAACGRPVLIPFKPDGVRPIYCEEHIAMIKNRSKLIAGGASGVPQGGGQPRSDERKAEQISRPRERRRDGRRGPPTQHLPQLREALAEVLQAAKQNQQIASPLALPESEQRPGPAPDKGQNQNRAGNILAPGQSVSFD